MSTVPRKNDAPSADEAFALLSDGTRVAILRTIWEASDPVEPDPVPFSEIRERMDGRRRPRATELPLNKLRAHFIRRTEDGYELREPGRRIVTVLISGTAISDASIEPVVIDATCVFCGAPTRLSYEDGWRLLECTECNVQCVDSYPDGVVSMHELPPSVVVDRSPNEVHEADLIWSKHRRSSVIDGICPDCVGPMPVTSLWMCEDHTPSPNYEEACGSCGSVFWTEAVSTCEICPSVWKMPIQFHLAAHPAVVAFYYDRGIVLDLATYEHRSYLLTYREELISEDPLRIHVTIPLEGDELHVTVDGDLDVLAVTGSSDSRSPMASRYG